jgi:protein SCO1/2
MTAGRQSSLNKAARPHARRRAFVLAAALVLADLAACAPASRQPAAVSIGGPFRLTDQHGRRVDQTLLRGKWTLVYFGYTFCPDVCPATLSNLAAALDRLGPRSAAVQVVFITVDPRRDTPQQLESYLTSPSFPKGTIGLTGSGAEIAAVAAAYHVYYRRAGEGSGYSVDHTSVIYLMDPRGRFARPIGFGAAPGDVARQIGEAMAGG